MVQVEFVCAGVIPLHCLHYRRHVHHEGYDNWRDQAHLHEEIQKGAHGDEIAILLNYFLF